MSRLNKGADYNDDQARKYFETEAGEWYEKMGPIWNRNNSTTDAKKTADIIEQASLYNFIDVPLITRIPQIAIELEGDSVIHPYTFVPQTAQEEKDNRLATASTYAQIHYLRRSPLFADLAIVTGVKRPDPHLGGWERSTLLNVKPLRNEKHQTRLESFMGRWEKDLDGRKQTLDMIIRNARRPEEERMKIKERRRKEKSKESNE